MWRFLFKKYSNGMRVIFFVLKRVTFIQSSQFCFQFEGRSHMDVIQEVEMSSEGRLEDEKREDKVEKAGDRRNSNGKKAEIRGFRPASLEILDHVKINVTPETPVSTLKGILMMSSNSDLSFSKRELRKAEEQMTRAFIEFNRKLLLLKSYW